MSEAVRAWRELAERFEKCEPGISYRLTETDGEPPSEEWIPQALSEKFRLAMAHAIQLFENSPVNPGGVRWVDWVFGKSSRGFEGNTRLVDNFAAACAREALRIADRLTEQSLAAPATPAEPEDSTGSPEERFLAREPAGSDDADDPESPTNRLLSLLMKWQNPKILGGAYDTADYYRRERGLYHTHSVRAKAYGDAWGQAAREEAEKHGQQAELAQAWIETAYSEFGEMEALLRGLFPKHLGRLPYLKFWDEKPADLVPIIKDLLFIEGEIRDQIQTALPNVDDITDLHWLSGWGKRIDAMLENENFSVQYAWMALRPDALADTAIMRFSLRYPDLIQRIRDCQRHLEERYKECQADENEDSRYHLACSALELSQKILTVSRLIRESPGTGTAVSGRSKAVDDQTGCPPVEWSEAKTPKQWAAMYDVSVKTFKRMRERGEIRCHPDSTARRVRIDVRDLP